MASGLPCSVPGSSKCGRYSRIGGMVPGGPGQIASNATVISLTAARQALDFDELMREHRAMVFSVLWHFLHDRDLAEELATGSRRGAGVWRGHDGWCEGSLAEVW